MVRHLYNIIESLRQQIRDLEGRALLDPPVPLSFKEDDDLARMRIALDEKIALAVEKWGVNWVAAGLAEFRQLYGGAVFSPVLEGDEVLDWREMRDRYAGCAMRVLPRDTPGSDHALSRFDDQMPEVLAFAGLSDRALTR